MSPIELANPHVEFTHRGYNIVTRAALDETGKPTGELELIAPIELFVEVHAQALFPNARRFLVDHGLMYQASPEVIKELEHLLVMEASRMRVEATDRIADHRKE